MRELALQERDAEGKPKHRTKAMLMESKNADEVTEFEKLLYRTFEESPDPMALVKILKRKLSINDPENGPRYVKIIDELLEKEPLRQFVLYSKRSYYSNEVFDQIEKLRIR